MQIPLTASRRLLLAACVATAFPSAAGQEPAMDVSTPFGVCLRDVQCIARMHATPAPTYSEGCPCFTYIALHQDPYLAPPRDCVVPDAAFALVCVQVSEMAADRMEFYTRGDGEPIDLRIFYHTTATFWVYPLGDVPPVGEAFLAQVCDSTPACTAPTPLSSLAGEVAGTRITLHTHRATSITPPPEDAPACTQTTRDVSLAGAGEITFAIDGHTVVRSEIGRLSAWVAATRMPPGYPSPCPV